MEPDRQGEGLPRGVESRLAAYKALRRVHATGAWSVQAVDSVLATAPLDARDRAFAASLAYETLRWQGTLDWALRQALNRPIEGVQPELVDILRLGAWQLLRSGAPDSAAVGTCVDVARVEVGPQATGFVNGVLRGLARRKAQLPWPAESTDHGLGLALGYPEWVVASARERFGDRARAVLEAGNVAPGVTLRAVGDRDALIAELRAQGVPAEAGAAAAEAVRAPGAYPAELPSVAEGRAVVQDEASMLVAHAVIAGLDAAHQPWKVLEVAAAPGGKAAHLALMGAWVAGGDLRHSRARMVAATAARLGVESNVAAVAADGLRPPWRRGAFDAVLLDAPCTGLGVVRRRPELRWRRAADDPQRLAALQLGLLDASADLVRPGGWLVYSACTWTTAETLGVATAFAAARGDRFAAEPLDGALAGAGMRFASDPGTQLAPDRDGTDGMYVCGFRAS
ncbi:MAG TPA: transcription antitermination factor NusB [Egibacteraceae bacterium]|nr:transcription antitermination factor NusB [Egibacteraceae bacterium]